MVARPRDLGPHELEDPDGQLTSAKPFLQTRRREAVATGAEQKGLVLWQFLLGVKAV